MSKMTPAAMTAKAALFTYLTPRLIGQDSKLLDFDSLVKGVNSKNYKQKKAGIALSVREAMKGKMAQDADIMDLANLLDALSPAAEQADQQMMTEPNSAVPMASQGQKEDEGQDDDKSDIVAKIKAYLQQEGIPPAILQNLDAFLAEEGNPPPDVGEPKAEPPPAEGKAAAPPPNGKQPNGGDQGMASTIPPPNAVKGLDENELEDCVSGDEEEDEEERKKREAEDEIVPSEQSEPVTKQAMDSAIRAAVSKAQRDAIANQRAIRTAERFVRPWVGDLAMDSARPADVYRTALKALGMDAKRVDGMHPDALLPVLEAQPKPGVRKPNQGPRLASDSKIEGGSFLERFPDAKGVTVQ